MYESGYHGAYAVGNSEHANTMHKSPSQSEYVSAYVLLALGLAISCADQTSTNILLAWNLPRLIICTRAGFYQGKFGQSSFTTDDHSAEDTSYSTGMPATHSEATCAYQGRFGTMPEAKVFEPQHSGELERKGSAYHGYYGQ
ncbi:hypothetical protein MMC14_010281 [Varicellaria rhodocarpa]|nr:hypothetical protein [Varicellaria rhodocarpa]